MPDDPSEEQQLRSVALQNAQSILAARQRAEEDLLRAKDDLERKSNELARSLAMMNATLEATSDGILVTDSNQRITGCNRRFIDMWKLPPDIAATGSHASLLEFCSRYFTTPDAFIRQVTYIYETSPVESIDVLSLNDGRTFERLSRTQTIDGQNVGRVWTFRDITERKRTDEIRFRLAAIVESSDDCIVSKTLTGIITTWNAGAQRMFGYTPEEAIGKSITILIPPERINEETDIIGRIRKGERVEHYETVRVRKNGERIDVSLTVSPVKDNEGRIIGASKIARDITARKRMEETLKGLYDSLKTVAAEREHLLDAERAARSEAERVGRLKDEFLATLSHELRTPLNAILGWSQLLQNRPSEEDLAEGLEVIQRNTHLQRQLIEDLLDMSRIISGKIRLDVQDVDVRDIINAAIASVRPSADAKDIRLQLALDPLAGPVRGDPNRLQQCLWNLLSNAIKFTPKGGRVHVSLARISSHVEVCVSDSGQGIKPEFLPHVFERFRQADGSTTRTHGGLGLGLALVKYFVELHGGTVRATSQGEGHGASFCIELPLTALYATDGHSLSRFSPSAASARSVPADHPSLKGISVLAIDDELDARTLIKRVLEDCGASVTTAASAAEGLEALKHQLPHMIISDIGMPGTDGYDFIKQVRRLPPDQGSRIPAAALTAFARAEDRTRALRAGYQTHIAKPVEPTELTAVVLSLALKP